ANRFFRRLTGCVIHQLKRLACPELDDGSRLLPLLLLIQELFTHSGYGLEALFACAADAKADVGQCVLRF
ncbi:hypothetical protein, partial [Polaromonas sp.]|uniref:hypothetical protein n=1 Tax=Polaromonas sp. TaxID=1869339 RepID=UPI00273138C3